MARFKKKKVIEPKKKCFDILYNFCLKHFSFYEEFSKILPSMYIRLHVKHT